MEDVKKIAAYIYNRYKDEYGIRIDEMKLHKLLYFAQRESMIQNRVPLFNAVFYGWKYGPILKEIRQAYRDDDFEYSKDKEFENRIIEVMDKIFRDYAGKDSWSLSRLTHGEFSWQQSRNGISEQDNSDNPIDVKDIMVDADRIRTRRNALSKLGLI